jgi:hypothetical protein
VWKYRLRPLPLSIRSAQSPIAKVGKRQVYEQRRLLLLIEPLNNPDQRLCFHADVTHAGLAQVYYQKNPA